MALCATFAAACAAGPAIEVPAAAAPADLVHPAALTPAVPAVATSAEPPPSAIALKPRETTPATKYTRLRLLFSGGVTPREGRRFELRGPPGSGVVVAAAVAHGGRELDVRDCPLGVPLTVHLLDDADADVVSTQGSVTIPGSGDRLHLQLARTSDVVEVEVRVVGTDGRPVRGAELDIAWVGSLSPQTCLLSRAATDELGVARIRVARGERYVAGVARAPGFVDAVLDQFRLRRVSREIHVTGTAAPGPFDIAVAQTGGLRVTITFDGDPPLTYVSTMLQRVWPGGVRTGLWTQPEMTSRKEVGADGAPTRVVNEYPALEAGEYDVIVSAAGRPTETRTATVVECETTAVAVTPGRAPGAVLVELVADRSAGDDPAISFRLARLDRDAGLQVAAGNVTSASPKSLITGLLPGAYLLIASHGERAVPVNVGQGLTRVSLAPPPPAVPNKPPFLTVRCVTDRGQSAIGLHGVITRPGVDWRREGTWIRCARLSGAIAGLERGSYVLHVLDGLDACVGFAGGVGPVVPFEWDGQPMELHVPLGK